MLNYGSSKQQKLIDTILDAYECGVAVGQDFEQVSVPYPRESVQAYAYLKGMAYGMRKHSDNLQFDSDVEGCQNTAKTENYNG